MVVHAFPVHLKDLSEGSCCNRMLSGHTCSRLSGHRRISCTRNHTYRYVWILVQLILLSICMVPGTTDPSVSAKPPSCMSTKHSVTI